jgi:hypothetical protein
MKVLTLETVIAISVLVGFSSSGHAGAAIQPGSQNSSNPAISCSRTSDPCTTGSAPDSVRVQPGSKEGLVRVQPTRGSTASLQGLVHVQPTRDSTASISDTSPVPDSEDARVDRMISGICRGC